jgi:hypothetical protein
MRMASAKGKQTNTNPALIAALVVVIIVAIIVVVKVGGGLVKDTMADRNQMGPSQATLQKLSLPGHTPYGQPPKPGEIRRAPDQSRDY